MRVWTRKERIVTVLSRVMGWIAFALALIAWLALVVLWTEPSVGFRPIVLIYAVLFSGITGLAFRQPLRALVIRHRPRPWVLRLFGRGKAE